MRGPAPSRVDYRYRSALGYNVESQTAYSVDLGWKLTRNVTVRTEWFEIPSQPMRSRATVRETRVQLPTGVTLWYETRGSADDPAIVLVAGHGSQGIEWPEDFRDALAAAGRYVVCFDNRDAGLSDSFSQRWAAGERYDMHDMLADLTALLDHLSLPRPHLVGFSMGGILTQLLARPCVDRAASLGLISSTPLYRKEPLEPAFPRYEEVLRPAPADDTAAREAYLRRLWGAMAGKAFPYEEARQGPLIRRVVERGWSAGRVRRQHRAAVSTGPFEGELPRVPTWIVHGDDDPVGPLSHGEILARELPHAHFEVVPGLGHQLHPELLMGLIPRVLAFTDGSRSDASGSMD